MQGAEILRVLRCAAIAEIVQIIADGLIGDDEFNGIVIMLPGKKSENCSPFAVKRFVFKARERLTAQLRIGDASGALLPLPQKGMRYRPHLQKHLGGQRNEVGRYLQASLLNDLLN